MIEPAEPDPQDYVELTCAIRRNGTILSYGGKRLGFGIDPPVALDSVAQSTPGRNLCFKLRKLGVSVWDTRRGKAQLLTVDCLKLAAWPEDELQDACHLWLEQHPDTTGWKRFLREVAPYNRCFLVDLEQPQTLNFFAWSADHGRSEPPKHKNRRFRCKLSVYHLRPLLPEPYQGLDSGGLFGTTKRKDNT